MSKKTGKKSEIMDIPSLLAAREDTHGNFIDQAAMSQVLKEMMVDGKNWDELTAVQREALEMIQHKIARILSGNPDELDHWRDIAGYAMLVERLSPVTQSQTREVKEEE